MINRKNKLAAVEVQWSISDVGYPRDGYTTALHSCKWRERGTIVMPVFEARE